MAILEVDGVAIEKQYKASCHCGSVEILFDLPNGLEDLRR